MKTVRQREREREREKERECERAGKRHVHVPVLICSRKLLVLRLPPRPTLTPACRHPHPVSFLVSECMVQSPLEVQL